MDRRTKLIIAAVCATLAIMTLASVAPYYAMARNIGQIRDINARQQLTCNITHTQTFTRPCERDRTCARVQMWWTYTLDGTSHTFTQELDYNGQQVGDVRTCWLMPGADEPTFDTRYGLMEAAVFAFILSILYCVITPLAGGGVLSAFVWMWVCDHIPTTGDLQQKIQLPPASDDPNIDLSPPDWIVEDLARLANAGSPPGGAQFNAPEVTS